MVLTVLEPKCIKSESDTYRSMQNPKRVKSRFILILLILSTVDGASGADWTRCIGINGSLIRNIEACGNTLYAAKYQEIYKSADNGHSWSTVNYENYDFSDLVAFRNYKYIIKKGTIYRSFCTDTAWQSILTMSAPRFLKVSDSGIQFLQNDTIFSANLDGSDVQPITPKLPFAITDYDFLDSTIYVLGEKYKDSSGIEHERNIHYCKKGASNWSTLTDFQFPDHITAMRVCAGRLFAGRMRGLLVWSEVDSLFHYLSDTKKQSWVKSLYNIKGKLIIVPWDPVVFDDAALQAEKLDKAMFLNNKRKNETVDMTAGDSALFVLNNTVNVGAVEAYGYPFVGNEVAWDKEYTLFNGSVMGTGASISNVIFDGRSLWAFSDFEGVLKSSDTGVTWTIINPVAIRSIRSAAKLGSKLFVVTSAFVYVSSDGGVNWNQVDLPSATSKTILDVFFTKTGIYITSTDGFFYTDETGEKWNHVEQYAKTTNSAAFNGKNGWFFRNDTVSIVKHSSDGGITWNTVFQGSASEQFNTISADENGVYVSSNEKGILFSGNKDTTWQSRNNGISDSLFVVDMLGIGHTSFAATKKDSSWGGGWSSTRGEVFTWSDSAERWLKVSIPKALSSYAQLHPLGPYILAWALSSGEYNEMFLSADTGDKWVSLGAIRSTGSYQQLCYAFTNKEILVGTNMGLWRHDIANPIDFYTPIKFRYISRSQSAIEFTLKGREMQFFLQTRIKRPPVLILYSINGQRQAIIRPGVFENNNSKAIFPLNGLPHGVYVWRLFEDGRALRSGKIIYKN